MKTISKEKTIRKVLHKGNEVHFPTFIHLKYPS